MLSLAVQFSLIDISFSAPSSGPGSRTNAWPRVPFLNPTQGRKWCIVLAGWIKVCLSDATVSHIADISPLMLWRWWKDRAWPNSSEKVRREPLSFHLFCVLHRETHLVDGGESMWERNVLSERWRDKTMESIVSTLISCCLLHSPAATFRRQAVVEQTADQKDNQVADGMTNSREWTDRPSYLGGVGETVE